MKKVFTALVIVMMLMVGCVQIDEAEKVETQTGRFIVVENIPNCPWIVVADRETSVMYVMSYGAHNIGNFTMLVNADGDPLLRMGEKSDGID